MEGYRLYIGPSKYRHIEEFDFDEKNFLEFLESKREKLDVYHRHALVVCISPNLNQRDTVSSKPVPFHLNFVTTANGEKLVGLTLSNPLHKTPAIYRMDDPPNLNEFCEKFRMLYGGAEPCAVQSGVIRLPFKTRFIAACGPSVFLEKELFGEKMLGSEALSFAARLDDASVERLEKLRDGSFGKLRTTVTDEGIFVFLVDRSVSEDMRNVLSEVVSVLRKRYGLRPASYFPVRESVLGSFTLELGTIFSDEPLKKVIELVEHYDIVKKNLEKMLQTGRSEESGGV